MPPPGLPRPPRRIVVLADLAGDAAYHAGDEAMAEATIEWLRSLSPQLAITVASADPAATAARLDCTAVPWVGFASCATDSERATLTREVTDSSDDLPLLVDAVTSADALVIAGGGNLNSMWPEHVHERALAVTMAKRADLPIVVTGQTLGPFDTTVERDAVAGLLEASTVVGVREPHSAAEARLLGVDDERLILAPDDAVSLHGVRPVGRPDGLARTIAVTIHPFAPEGHERYAELGRQLGRLAERVGAQVLFVPHVHTPEGNGMSDLEVASALAEHCGGDILEMPTAREAAWASHTAWLVVSSRYHPIVFASAAAVPSLALTWGHYTSVKCRGALGHVGVEPWWVGLEDAADGLLLEAAGELARRREEVADWMAEHLDELAARDAWRRWRIAGALGFAPGPEPVVTPAAVRSRTDAPRPAGGWAAMRA